MDSYSVCSPMRSCFRSLFFVRFLHVWGVAVVYFPCYIIDGPRFMYPFCRLILALCSGFGYYEKSYFENSRACLLMGYKVIVPIPQEAYESSHCSTSLPLYFCESVYKMKIILGLLWKSWVVAAETLGQHRYVKFSKWKPLKCHRPGMVTTTWHSSFWIFLLMHAFLFFNEFFYWSIVDLQCFRCTAKWFSYTYIYIYSFSDSFPL